MNAQIYPPSEFLSLHQKKQPKLIYKEKWYCIYTQYSQAIEKGAIR